MIGPLDHAEPGYRRGIRRLAVELEIGDQSCSPARPIRGRGTAGSIVVALTSRSEAQPLALLEAMAAGVPVVAHRGRRLSGAGERGGPARGAADPGRRRARRCCVWLPIRELRARLGAAGRVRAPPVAMHRIASAPRTASCTPAP